MARYLALKSEAEYGTAVVPDKFIDVVGSALASRNNIIYIDNVNAVDFLKHVAGPYAVAGEFPIKVEPENIGHILLGTFGVAAAPAQQGTTTAYLHAFTPQTEDNDLDSFTIGVGLKNIKERRFAGCKIKRLTLACAAGDLLLGTVAVVGKTDSLETIQTPTFSTLKPFKWSQCTVTRAGSGVKPVGMEFNLENIFDEEDYRLTTSRFIETLEWLSRRISGLMDLKFEAEDDLKLFYGSATATAPADTIETLALNFKFEGPIIEDPYKYTLELKLPKVVYDLANVNVNLRDRLIQGIEWTAEYDATAQYVAAVDLINKVSTQYA